MPSTKSSYEQSLERFLFEYETTYKSDYRGGAIREPIVTTLKPKPRCQSLRPPPLKDIHTLSDWNGAPPPFCLTVKQKDIVRTDPTQLQEPYFKPADPHLDEARRTRPRLAMTPAVNMDDIPAPARGILCGAMYASATARALAEAVSSYPSVKAPLPDFPAPADPIALKKLSPPLVSPEWRKDSVSWDRRQLRAHCDANRDFWLRTQSRCRACDDYEAVKAHRKMQRQMLTRQ